MTRSKEFENDYGIMCIRVVAICIQVAVLSEAGDLQGFIDETAEAKPNQNLRPSGFIVNILFPKLDFGVSPFFSHSLDPLHWLPEFTAEHAEILLEYLHTRRDLFLLARNSQTDCWGEWPVLFYAVWVRIAQGDTARCASLWDYLTIR